MEKIFTNPSDSKEVIFAMAWNYETDGALGGWPQLLGASNTNNGYRMSQPILMNSLIDYVLAKVMMPVSGIQLTQSKYTIRLLVYL